MSHGVSNTSGSVETRKLDKLLDGHAYESECGLPYTDAIMLSWLAEKAPDHRGQASWMRSTTPAAVRSKWHSDASHSYNT